MAGEAKARPAAKGTAARKRIAAAVVADADADIATSEKADLDGDAGFRNRGARRGGRPRR